MNLIPDLGDCCKKLKDAMTMPPESTIRIEDNGVMYLSIGYAVSEKGVGWYDQAILFCPFCGRKIQDEDDIRKKGAPSNA